LVIMAQQTLIQRATARTRMTLTNTHLGKGEVRRGKFGRF
jgi:hypothetical protein